MPTFYANTKYGYVKRTSHGEYKHWSLVVLKMWDETLRVEVSFHQAGKTRRFPTNTVYHQSGDVSDAPVPGLQELKKNDRGHREIPAL